MMNAHFTAKMAIFRQASAVPVIQAVAVLRAVMTHISLPKVVRALKVIWGRLWKEIDGTPKARMALGLMARVADALRVLEGMSLSPQTKAAMLIAASRSILTDHHTIHKALGELWQHTASFLTGRESRVVEEGAVLVRRAVMDATRNLQFEGMSKLTDEAGS